MRASIAHSSGSPALRQSSTIFVGGRFAEADILLVQGVPPESEYRFKHALIQDAAYENLLKSRRQALHRVVAEILRDKFPAIAAAEPEVLAHHFTQAGLDDAAIERHYRASYEGSAGCLPPSPDQSDEVAPSHGMLALN
jgi:hypothetical protein